PAATSSGPQRLIQAAVLVRGRWFIVVESRSTPLRGAPSRFVPKFTASLASCPVAPPTSRSRSATRGAKRAACAGSASPSGLGFSHERGTAASSLLGRAAAPVDVAPLGPSEDNQTCPELPSSRLQVAPHERVPPRRAPARRRARAAVRNRAP